VIGAIANYTRRARCLPGVSDMDRIDAVKFLLHFIGDISQPLHTCGRDRGGNDVKVNINGTMVKLHAAWDTTFLEARMKLFASADAYEKYLVEYAQNRRDSGWVSPHDIYALSKNGNSLAAIDWTVGTTVVNCETIWPMFDLNPKGNFGLEYFDNAIPVLDLALSRAGYRLGNWMNMIFDGECKEGGGVNDVPVTVTVVPGVESSSTVLVVESTTTVSMDESTTTVSMDESTTTVSVVESTTTVSVVESTTRFESTSTLTYPTYPHDYPTLYSDVILSNGYTLDSMMFMMILMIQ
jgi:hypothetical protein